MALMNANILMELECPVCTEYLCPPIRQCVSGHSFCNRCYHKLKHCSMCRGALSDSRNFVMEKLHAKIVFPCKNRLNGCAEVSIGSNIMEHESWCHFGIKKCPLKIINDCEWTGMYKDILEHCNKEHSNNIFSSSCQKLTCNAFNDLVLLAARSVFFVILHAHDELFKCAWEIDFDTGLMRWCVFILGQPKEQYEYQIVIPDLNCKGKRIIFGGPCNFISTDEEVDFEDDSSFIMTSFNMVKNYCRNDDLLYIVKIFRRVD